MEHHLTEPLDYLGRALKIGALLALLAAPAMAMAEDALPAAQPAAQQSDKAEPAAEAADIPLPPPSITKHSMRLAGIEVPYTAKAGPLALRDVKGKLLASIFYVAYTREPQDTKRPITFVFNGGPGAASAYLHLGAIGPKAVEVNAKGELLGPPARLVANDASWLDFTDLVFVDPVGTGYSRAGDGKNEGDFWGVDQDTEALANFIRLYLIDAGRMSSPVFLAGESYGGFRAATITRSLQKTGGISPSGLVLISPALEFAILHGEDYEPLPFALGLPSYAAVNLESKGVSGRDALAAALHDAEHYALNDYLVALASGAEQGANTASEHGRAAHRPAGRHRAPEFRAHLPRRVHQGIRSRPWPGAEPL